MTVWLLGAWQSIVTAIKAVAKWLWAHPAAIAAAIGTLVGAVFMVRSKKNQIGHLSDALEVQKIKNLVVRDEAKVEMLSARADEHAEEVAQLHNQIVASKRRAAELAHATSLEGKSDDEVAKLFSDAGL